MKTRTKVDVQRHAMQWRQIPQVSALVRRAARAAVAEAGVTLLPDVELSVSLADNHSVRAANRDWREKDKPTNVLSFPSVAADRLAAAPYLGDIIVAFEMVAAESMDEGKRFEDHLTHLVVHGVLHLLGFDHMTKPDAEAMEALETAILAGLKVADPYAGSEPLET